MAAVAAAVTFAALGSTSSAAATFRDPPTEPEVVIEGRGFGHGVGMAQDGAYAMGLAGASAADILATFYPGTGIGERWGAVQVQLFDRATSSVVLGFPAGGELGERQSGGQSDGLPVKIRPGGSVRVSFEDGYRVTPMDGAEVTHRPPPATTPSEPLAGSPLWAAPPPDSTVDLPGLAKRYRGTIEVRAAGQGLQLFDHLDVEDYLRGMGEVQAPGWPAAALQAQAIVARTYALRFAAAGQPLCSSQQCQVYLGQTAEYAAMNRAVVDTAGQVVTYRGGLVETVYSASGGGISATAEEGFGPGSPVYPYLQAVPYPTQDPQPWVERLTLRDLASRVGYPGEASDVKVTRAGPSGRPLEVTFTGDGGDVAVDGHSLWDRLGLRSTLYTIRVERPPDPVGLRDPSAVGAVAQTGPPSSGAAVRSPGAVFEAGVVNDRSLGRAPWVALALLLMAGASLATVRTGSRQATAGAHRPYSEPPGSTAASPAPPRSRRRRSGPAPRSGRTGSPT